MAIAPTGAFYKSLYFDGVSSREYGVYITGEAVFNAPQREVEMISIPGRNGQFALDKGRFENIEVTYPAGIFADTEEDFAQAISDLRNFLCSRQGYVRLSDDYNSDEYRMAVYKSGLEVSPKQLRAGEFNIVFDCKPQRWLTSGETAIEVESGDTLTNPTPFDAQPLLEVEGYGDIEFNGYDIHIANMQIGEVIVKNGETRTVLITTDSLTPEQELDEFTLNLDVGALEVGDTINTPTFRIECIYKSHDIQQITAFYEIDPPVGLNLIAASIIDATTVQFIAEIEGTSFVYGTAKETELASVTYNLGCIIDSPQHTFWQYQYIRFHLTYDGADKLTVHSLSTHAAVTYFATNKTVTFGNINAVSTQDLSGHPTYIDCDLGEAYKIESGSIVSLNRYIDLGSDLPVLASGANEIAFDNTVSDLKVKPNWWKV